MNFVIPKQKYKKQKKSTPGKGNIQSDNSLSDQSLLTNSNVGNKSKNKTLLTNITEALSCVYNSNNTSQQTNYDNVNMNHSFNQGSNQYTPIQSSTPGMSYPMFQQFQPNLNTFTSPPPPMPMPSTNIESLLKELCCKMSNVENKLQKLDSIEDRLNKMDSKFSLVDSELKYCKDKIIAIEHSAEFLSNIHDEHIAIKARLDKITNSIATSKSVNIDVKDRLIDVETKTLRYNLLFFSIEEKANSQNAEGGRDDGTGMVTDGTDTEKAESENCKEKVLEFCENTLKMENVKENINIDYAYRLGKKKFGDLNPRPIVVKFTSFNDRESVRKLSGRLRDTKFGISPQFPPEILAKRKKMIPVMIQKRKEKKKAFLVGDKLFVDGVLWKG